MAGNRPQPFFDANVLFSALSRDDSPPGVLLDFHVAGRIAVVVSARVLDEVARNLEKNRPEVTARLRSIIAETPFEAAPSPSNDTVNAVTHCIDAKDAPILAAAITSGADCIVSGNTRRFNQQAAECAGIAIFTPAAYLAALDRSNGMRR
jgi:predicted nucleic acid-binding protein